MHTVCATAAFTVQRFYLLCLHAEQVLDQAMRRKQFYYPVSNPKESKICAPEIQPDPLEISYQLPDISINIRKQYKLEKKKSSQISEDNVVTIIAREILSWK